MSAQLRRAELVPFEEKGQKPDDTSKIAFDFNPETLTIKVQNSLQDVPGRKGRQRTQFVGSSTSTLTFDAYFDSTRPKGEPGKDGGERPEDLDVRERTKKIAALLQVSDPDAKHPAPRRVQFRWGSIVFEGVFDTYTEVLEYFSPEGVPLRAKVSISLKEQKFEYQIDSTKRAQVAGFRGGPGDLLEEPGGEGPLGLDMPGGLSFEANLSGGFGFQIEGELNLGIGIDLAASAGVSLDVSAGAALEVFGGAAVSAALGGEVDVSAVAKAGARAPSGPIQPAAPRPAWAPEGPLSGTRASALAEVVHAGLRAGATSDASESATGLFSATDLPARKAIAPLPVKGSPPRTVARVGEKAGAVFQKARFRPASATSLSGGRPSWEGSSTPTGSGGAGSTPCSAPCCTSCGQPKAGSFKTGCATCGGGKPW